MSVPGCLKEINFLFHGEPITVQPVTRVEKRPSTGIPVMLRRRMASALSRGYLDQDGTLFQNSAMTLVK
jgi:hypothetical protein